MRKHLKTIILRQNANNSNTNCPALSKDFIYESNGEGLWESNSMNCLLGLCKIQE